MKMNDTFILKPIHTFTSSYTGTKSYEQVLVSDESDYPVALMHVDNFSNMHSDDDIYSRLQKGETITVQFTVKEVEA